MGPENSCQKLGVAACTCNPGDGEPETGGPRGLLVSKPCNKWQFFLFKYIIKEGKKRGESLRGRGGLREGGKERTGYFRMSEEPSV